MTLIDKPDLKYGFWLGIGLLLAFLIWHLVSRTLGRVAQRNG